MKKILALTLALMLLIGMTACGSTEPEVTTGNNNISADPTTGDETPATDPAETTPPTPAEEGYSFLLKEIKLVPGAVFDESQMPENSGKFEVPSCAIEGTDILYNYGVVEVTVFDAGEEPVIYSIYLLDANTPTDEGLYLGDDVATVESIYGTDYTEENNTLIYEKGDTQLRIMINNDAVFNIEYRATNI